LIYVHPVLLTLDRQLYILIGKRSDKEYKV
jgi:hypothetical protein